MKLKKCNNSFRKLFSANKYEGRNVVRSIERIFLNMLRPQSFSDDLHLRPKDDVPMVFEECCDVLLPVEISFTAEMWTSLLQVVNGHRQCRQPATKLF
jgi:hypothetical protein